MTHDRPLGAEWRARIVSNNTNHGFEMGTPVIAKQTKKGSQCTCYYLDRHDYWYCSLSDLEDMVDVSKNLDLI
jgi:hypothetical protein